MVKEDMPLSQDVEIALKLRVAITSAELGSYKNCVQPFIEHLLWARHWAKCLRCIFLLGYQDLDDTASKGQVELISCSSTWMSCVEKLIIGMYMGVFGHAGFAIRNWDHQRKDSCLKDVPLSQALINTSSAWPQRRHQTSSKGTRKPLESSSLNLREPALLCEA